jgi:hypothetical protein
MRPAVHVHRPRPPVHARTLGPRPIIRAQRLNPFVRRVWLAPEAVRARACSYLRRSCSGWRPARFRGQPPHTANRHVGGQQ